MICIYTPNITPRIVYTFKLVFTAILKIEYKLISDAVEFQQFSGAKFVYGDEIIDGAILIVHSGLLSETVVTVKNPEVITHEGIKCLFQGNLIL